MHFARRWGNRDRRLLFLDGRGWRGRAVCALRLPHRIPRRSGRWLVAVQRQVLAGIVTPAELKALEQAATPGPWSYERHATIYRVNENGRPVQLVIETGSPDGGETEPCWQGKDADTDILLAARNALPGLIRLWEAAEWDANDHDESRPTSCDASYAALNAALAELREMKL